ncbi:MAG: methyltransferase domain-containing protein [Thermoplasmata archaeon]|nr:methyltransferase domain-containing protein [Thermoplasmata archaeon]
MGHGIEEWLNVKGKEFLKNIGIEEGHRVLDFGCGNGVYSIPAARVAGRRGRVYVLDDDKNAIRELSETADSEGLDNIIIVEGTEEIEDESVDAALFYDVLHYMDKKQREGVYGEIRRILKTGGILSVYPKHNKHDRPLWSLSEMDIDDIVNEIENFGFHLEGKYTVRLIHNGNYGDGTVLNFRKGGTLAVAFGTDDGERLNDSHFGSAKFFHIYRFHDGNAELVEMRENIKIEEDESLRGGDPKKARATANALAGIDVLVGRRFGPNITRMMDKFVCVVARTDSIDNAADMVKSSMGRILAEMNKNNRRHIILTSPGKKE